MPRKQASSALAMLTTQVSATAAGAVPTEIRLLPAGQFKPADGRVLPCGSFRLTEADAQAVIALASARTNDFVIDYEHQTQLAEKNGQPAPAAGWFKQVEFRPDEGLFATDVRWTPTALKYLQNQEYRYLSATFHHDKKTGQVTRLECAALTNTPALDGLGELHLATLSARFDMADAAPAPQGGNSEETMNPVLLAMLKALGLPETAAEAEAVSAIAALKASADSVADLTTEIATLKSATPDPAKYASVETVAELQNQLTTLRAQAVHREVEEVISAAKAEGKVVPAVEQVWRDVGRADLTRLKALVAATPSNPVMAGKTQTDGKQPEGQTAETPTADALAICKAMGVSAEEFTAAAIG